MTRRFALLAALVALALSGSTAAAPTRKPAPAAPLPDVVRVALVTQLGTIKLDLDAKHAPLTVANFVAYVDQKRFDGTVFYRAMRLAWGTPPNGLIQGGTQNDPKRILKAVAHEPTTQTGIPHAAWTISMARNAPGTATGDFSILLSDMHSLDADPAAPGDNLGYAAFGHVVDWQEVARKIFDAPLSPTRGEGFMKGQMLAAPVKILTARRVTMVAPPATPVPPPAP